MTENNTLYLWTTESVQLEEMLHPVKVCHSWQSSLLHLLETIIFKYIGEVQEREVMLASLFKTELRFESKAQCCLCIFKKGKHKYTVYLIINALYLRI